MVAVTQWPSCVALLQLWLALTDKAKPYGLGRDVNGIFAALWAHFGISAIDTRVHLQGLRHDPRASLQEHAAMGKQLAQIANSDLSPVNRERYTFDAFVQSVNDLGLHHQFLARGVATVEDALREGEAYLLATQLHRSRVSSHQVAVNLSEDHCKPKPPAHVAAAAAGPPPDSEVTHMTKMVEKLVAALA